MLGVAFPYPSPRIRPDPCTRWLPPLPGSASPTQPPDGLHSNQLLSTCLLHVTFMSPRPWVKADSSRASSVFSAADPTSFCLPVCVMAVGCLVELALCRGRGWGFREALWLVRAIVHSEHRGAYT